VDLAKRYGRARIPVKHSGGSAEEGLMKRFSRRPISILVLVLTLCLFALAQNSGLWTFGSRTLRSVTAPVLSEATPIRIGVRSGVYLADIGGIAFDKVAIPNVAVADLDLRYDRFAMDGSRLRVTLNGQKLTTRLPDWQLVPIARYADSKYTACVTLFGQLTDGSHPEDAFVINYHAGFANTLVGLRLFSLDHLLIDGDSADLPKWNGRYLLGRGEDLPNPTAGREAFRSVESMLIDGDRYDSYLISDYKRSVHFQPQNGELGLIGLPYFYFWAAGPGSTSDKPVPLYREALSDQISSRPDLLRKINPAAWDNGVAVMRYAAFFRYCKRNHPAPWNRLLGELVDVSITPAITTPTVLPQ
jgi:hypothetical protein